MTELSKKKKLFLVRISRIKKKDEISIQMIVGLLFSYLE